MIKDGKAKEIFSGGSSSGDDALTDSAFAHQGPPKNEKERIARERIDANKYDIEAWETYAHEAQTRPIAQASAMFEQILATFPSSGKFWNMYAEVHVNAKNDDGARYVFSRCLLNCLHIDLWKTYISFIRRVNEQRGPEGREEIRKAYEFTTSHVGMDFAAGPVWQDYVSFLKSIPVSSPQEDTQRTFLVRKVYQQAVLSPTHYIEQLWRDYESYENTISRALAKGLLTDFLPRFQSARAVYRERKKLWEQVDPNHLSVPPTGTLKEEERCAAWKQILMFEKSNPQRLDFQLLAKRVIFAFEQCLMSSYHYPDVWYAFAMWYAQTGPNENAVSIFWRAMKALPDSTVLHYAYAEFEEARGCIKEAKTIYETLVNNEKTGDSLSQIQLMRFIRRTEGIEAARKFFLEARKRPSCTYHLHVAAAMLAFTVDKDPKKARDIFELGLKDYIQEPNYVLEYADFLCRMNDDRNVRALFERALNVISPEESVEIWNRFVSFEHTYGDISSMLKVTQRRKEALAGEDGFVSDRSLLEVIPRYRFGDLWPCSSYDLDHLVQQESMMQKLSEKQAPSLSSARKTAGSAATAKTTRPVVRPDVSQMTAYGEPPLQSSRLGRQKDGKASLEETLKVLPPPLATFFRQLPPVEGPFPDVEMVLSIFLKKEVPAPEGVALAAGANGFVGGNLAAAKKRQKTEQDDSSIPSQAMSAPKDVFRMRQLQRSRGTPSVKPQQSAQQQQQQSTSGGAGSTFSGGGSVSSG